MGMRMLVATACFSLDVATWIGHHVLGGALALLASLISLCYVGLTHPCVHSLANRWAGFSLPQSLEGEPKASFPAETADPVGETLAV